MTIHEILWDTRTNLIDLIENRLKRLIHPDFKNLLEDFSSSINVVKRSISRTFQDLQSDTIDRLGQHGLTYEELRRKWKLFNRASELYKKHIGGRLGKAREVAINFLEIADVILDSLVMVIGSVGAVKEVKGTIKAGSWNE